MYYDILDKKRLDILPLLKNFKADFYLAGGTALALQLGHRDSVDFDFFNPNDFDTFKLFKKIKEVFVGKNIIKIQEEKNTLTVLIDSDIKISFFAYKYELIEKIIKEESLNLASIPDIAAMKLTAIISRATNKDYIDLYYVLHEISLNELLEAAKKKYPEIDINLFLKGLVYFDDIEMEPIIFKHNKEIDFDKVKEYLRNVIKL
jgi:predicted nucleotidyltransferase component of viral defense system